MDEGTPKFNSVEEEARYWKSLAKEYKQSFHEAREEMEEFQQSSRELEAELEAQLEQVERKNRELSSLVNRLQLDNDSLKERLERIHVESHRQVTELQNEMAQYKTIKDQLAKYIRELEQANDDLERTKRTTVVSLEDFESRMNCAIERNAFLESELDEKEHLRVTVQRLKDEARDLRQELQIRQREYLNSSPLPDNDKMAEKKGLESPVDSNKLTSDSAAPNTLPGSPHKSLGSMNGQPVPLTPSARISALNIVGDLLRKVGALESKLASCRNFVKEAPVSDSNLPNTETLRGKRVGRGASVANAPAPIPAST